MEQTFKRFYLEVDFDSFSKPKTKEELLNAPYDYGIYTTCILRKLDLIAPVNRRDRLGVIRLEVPLDSDTTMSAAAELALESLVENKGYVGLSCFEYRVQFIKFALDQIRTKHMKDHRRFILLIEYFGEDCKLNDATVTIQTRSSDRLCVDRVVKVSQTANRQSNVTTTCIVEITLELGTPLSLAAKQARDFVIYHRDTEVKERLTEDEYDDLIFTLDSISN